MDNKISRIPKFPTRFPTKRVLSELDLNGGVSEEPPKKQPPPVRKFLSRRSKSCADLTKPQANGSKFSAVSRLLPKKTTQPPLTKSSEDIRTGVAKKVELGKTTSKVVTTVKRKLEKAEEPKAKVVKPTKPAPYDYKAR